MDLFGRSKFILAFILTFFLLSLYVYFIRKIYCTNWIQHNKQKGGKRWDVVKTGLFLLITLLQAIIVQFILLVGTDKWIWETAYFKYDYPFLAIPLALYIVGLEWIPFVGRPKVQRQEQNRLSDISLADQEDFLHVVPAGESEETSSAEKGSPDSNIRLRDIVGGESHNKYCILYLTNGERFPIHLSLKKMMKKRPGNWIIKTNGRFFVLAWAVDIHKSTSKRIVLNRKIEEQLETSLGKENLENFLFVSRYYGYILREFLKSEDSANNDNWDIPIG
ncbi:hypothetical protein [Sphingobacterium wenxiniae]|nr:hypothetical protein [Sphingobacterium wenxiniae]